MSRPRHFLTHLKTYKLLAVLSLVQLTSILWYYSPSSVWTSNLWYDDTAPSSNNNHDPFLPLQQRSSLLLPEVVLQRFIEEHSVEAVERDLALNNNKTKRKYSVAYYSCPHRVGNMLHSFFNAAVWSIITNRTLLWAYDGANVSTCDQHLHRASWIPSYEEYKERLPASPRAVLLNNYLNSGNRFYSVKEQRESLQHPVVVFPQIPIFKVSIATFHASPGSMIRNSQRNGPFKKCSSTNAVSTSKIRIQNPSCQSSIVQGRTFCLVCYSFTCLISLPSTTTTIDRFRTHSRRHCTVGTLTRKTTAAKLLTKSNVLKRYCLHQVIVQSMS